MLRWQAMNGPFLRITYQFYFFKNKNEVFKTFVFNIAKLFAIHHFQFSVMNFTLSKIPSRTAQPRTKGLTMVSDKGLGLKEAENVLSVAAPYIDIVKLAFGTALVTPLLKEKIQLYQS